MSNSHVLDAFLRFFVFSSKQVKADSAPPERKEKEGGDKKNGDKKGNRNKIEVDEKN